MHGGDKKCVVILVENSVRGNLGSEVKCVIENKREGNKDLSSRMFSLLKRGMIWGEGVF